MKQEAQATIIEMAKGCKFGGETYNINDAVYPVKETMIGLTYMTIGKITVIQQNIAKDPANKKATLNRFVVSLDAGSTDEYFLTKTIGEVFYTRKGNIFKFSEYKNTEARKTMKKVGPKSRSADTSIASTGNSARVPYTGSKESKTPVAAKASANKDAEATKVA
jgi:hypothetical protein